MRPSDGARATSSASASGYVDPVKKYDTVVSSGQSALRALLTMNAGATVAFLTFVGNLWQKTTLPAQTTEMFARAQTTEMFVQALQLFIFGTFFTVLAFGTIFLTNVLSSQAWERTSNGMFGVTIICGLISICCFIAGSLSAIDGFATVNTIFTSAGR